MDDLRTRLHQIDDLAAPDLTDRIRPGQPRRGDVSTQEPQPSRGRRIAIAVVAFAVFGAAAGLGWAALHGGTSAVPGDESASPTVEEPSPIPSMEVAYLYPFFTGIGGWHTRDTGPVSDGNATTAWAATVPFDDRDLDPKAPAIPRYTIASLAPGEMLLTAEVVPWSHAPDKGPYPPGSLDRLDLATAKVRGPEAEEPAGTYSVLEIPDGYVLVRVYIGDSQPTADEIRVAQSELDTLQVPPVCPVPAHGPFGAQALPASGSPGDRVMVSGPMPFQHEDGTYDQRLDESMIAWWNVNPSDWVYLSSVPEPTPSPVGPGPAIRLGEDGKGMCSFDIPFTVPDVPPGVYPIAVIGTTGGSSTLEASIEFEVTSSGENSEPRTA